MFPKKKGWHRTNVGDLSYDMMKTSSITVEKEVVDFASIHRERLGNDLRGMQERPDGKYNVLISNQLRNEIESIVVGTKCDFSTAFYTTIISRLLWRDES